MKSRITFIIIFFLLILSGEESKSQDASKSSFNQGVAYFNAGNYEDALKLWTGLYDSGNRSANLNYNIANAYFKLNRIPEAILFYERAWLLDPSDEDINYNLQIARTLTVDRFQEIPELFFVKWYNFVSLFLSSNTWATVSMIFFAVFLGALSAYLYASRQSLKIAGFWIGLSFLLLSLASMAFSYRNKKLVYDSDKAIITTPILNGKSSPDNNGTDLFVLHEGTRVSIEDNVGDWYEIRLSDGNKGWVPSNTLTII